MAYIPDEHKQYPVLPYSREHGGEVFQYHAWPDQKLIELVGEHLIPYGYESYEQYFEKIDRIISEHSDEPETVQCRIPIRSAEFAAGQTCRVITCICTQRKSMADYIGKGKFSSGNGGT